MASSKDQEACQLYIKQEIDAGLANGKKPADIGREIQAWVLKYFEANIPQRTLEQRARRAKAKQEGPATCVASQVEDPNKGNVKVGKTKTDHGISKFITFYFSPCQENIFNLVVSYLGMDGKQIRRRSQEAHVDLQKLIDAIVADFEQKIRAGEIPSVPYADWKPVTPGEPIQEGAPETPQAQEGKHETT